MDFALSTDQEMLRDTTRAFVTSELSHKPLLRPDARPSADHFETSRQKIRQMGWQGVVVPEEYGGLGLGPIELAIISSELGRELAPAPFLGNIMGCLALQASENGSEKQKLLPRVATGDLVLALCASESSPHTFVGAVENNGWHLNGCCPFVLEGGIADVLVVPARTANGSFGLFKVDAADESSVRKTSLDWRDTSRQMTQVDLINAPGVLLSVDANEKWPWVRDNILVAIAAENAGGLRRVLDDTLEYVKSRWTFGQPVASYQAIKHAMADMLGQVECSEVASFYAAGALAAGSEDASRAAAIAKAYSADSYVEQARRSIQYCGAIGFTWEMSNHLFYKRALSNAQFFGNSSGHRRRALDLFRATAA